MIWVLIAAAVLPPRCALDDSLEPYVLRTIDPVIRASGAFSGVVVNRAAELPRMSIVVVHDHPSCAAAVAISGLCEAEENVVRCSSEGIRALVATDRDHDVPSPALQYVIAHEVSHLVHRDRGHFLPPASPVDGRLSQAAKWQAFRDACRDRDDATKQDLENEKRADKEALVVLERVRTERAAAIANGSPSAELSTDVQRIWVASNAIRPWAERLQGGARFPTVIDSAPLPATHETTRWAADRLICDLFQTRSGKTLLPVFNSNHSLEPERLALISTRFASLVHVGDSASATPSAQANDLATGLARADAIVDQEEAAFMNDLGAELCGRVRSAKKPDCAHVASRAPKTRPDCPKLSATVEATGISPQTETVSIDRTGGAVSIAGEAVFALPLSNGNLFVVLATPPAAAIVAGNKIRAWRLPCIPSTAVEFASTIEVLCRAPAEVIDVASDGPTRLRHFVHVRFQEEEIGDESFFGGWIGVVDGTMLVTLQFPGSGASALAQVNGSTARSAPATQGPNCSVLGGGMSVTRVGTKPYGFTWNPLATARVVRFNEAFDDAETFAAPNVLGCGPSAQGAICASRNTVFDPFAPRRRIPFAPTIALARSTRAHARLCHAAATTWLMLQSSGADAVSTEIHVRRDTEATFSTFFTGEGKGELSCAGGRAAVVIAGPTGSKVLELH